MSIAGYDLSIQKQKDSDSGLMDKNKIQSAIEVLRKYRQGKESLESKIIQNEQWYKMRHWEIIRGKKSDGTDPEPVTAYLFNTLANKHADAMDSFPEPSFLPVEQNDEQEAESLTSIVPIVLEKCNYEQVYDRSWWYKLKQGTGVKGVFWNPELENGLGGIDIVKLDLLNIYWESGINDRILQVLKSLTCKSMFKMIA